MDNGNQLTITLHCIIIVICFNGNLQATDAVKKTLNYKYCTLNTAPDKRQIGHQQIIDQTFHFPFNIGVLLIIRDNIS